MYYWPKQIFVKTTTAINSNLKLFLVLFPDTMLAPLTTCFLTIFFSNTVFIYRLFTRWFISLISNCFSFFSHAIWKGFLFSDRNIPYPYDLLQSHFLQFFYLYLNILLLFLNLKWSTKSCRLVDTQTCCTELTAKKFCTNLLHRTKGLNFTNPNIGPSLYRLPFNHCSFPLYILSIFQIIDFVCLYSHLSSTVCKIPEKDVTAWLHLFANLCFSTSLFQLRKPFLKQS